MLQQVIAQFFPICNTLGQTIAGGCFWWQIISIFLLIAGPVGFVVFAIALVYRFLTSKEIEYVRSDKVKLKDCWRAIRETKGWYQRAVVTLEQYVLYTARGAWKPSTPAAKKVVFLFKPYRHAAMFFFGYLLAIHIVRALFLHLSHKKVNSVLMLTLQWMDFGVFLVMRPFNNKYNNVNTRLNQILNALTVAVVSLPQIFELPTVVLDFFGDTMAIYLNLVSTAVLLLGPILGMLDMVYQIFAKLYEVLGPILAPIVAPIVAVAVAKFQQIFSERTRAKLKASAQARSAEQQQDFEENESPSPLEASDSAGKDSSQSNSRSFVSEEVQDVPTAQAVPMLPTIMLRSKPIGLESLAHELASPSGKVADCPSVRVDGSIGYLQALHGSHKVEFAETWPMREAVHTEKTFVTVELYPPPPPGALSTVAGDSKSISSSSEVGHEFSVPLLKVTPSERGTPRCNLPHMASSKFSVPLHEALYSVQGPSISSLHIPPNSSRSQFPSVRQGLPRAPTYGALFGSPTRRNKDMILTPVNGGIPHNSDGSIRMSPSGSPEPPRRTELYREYLLPQSSYRDNYSDDEPEACA